MVPGYKMSAHFVTLFFYVRKKFTDINVGSLHDIRVSFHVLQKVAHSLVVTIIPNATSFTYMYTWWYAPVFLVFFHSQFFLSNKSRLRKIISYAKDDLCTHKMITRAKQAKSCRTMQGRSQYEANRDTRLGKILPNTVDFYFFYQTDNIRRFHTADFVQRTVCSPRL